LNPRYVIGGLIVCVIIAFFVPTFTTPYDAIQERRREVITLIREDKYTEALHSLDLLEKAVRAEYFPEDNSTNSQRSGAEDRGYSAAADALDRISTLNFGKDLWSEIYLSTAFVLYKNSLTALAEKFTGKAAALDTTDTKYIYLMRVFLSVQRGDSVEASRWAEKFSLSPVRDKSRMPIYGFLKRELTKNEALKKLLSETGKKSRTGITDY